MACVYGNDTNNANRHRQGVVCYRPGLGGEGSHVQSISQQHQPLTNWRACDRTTVVT